MALSFEEKKEKAKQDRSNAINQKLAILEAQATALETDEFNDPYFFGNGTYSGVEDIIDYYYNEKALLKNDTFDTPNILDGGYNDNTWKNEFDASLNGTSSDASPYYDDSTDQDLNLDSAWLNDNGGVTGTVGIIGTDATSTIQTLKDDINDIQTDRVSNPDNYDSTMRTALLASILDFIDKLDSSSNYQTLLGTISSEISDIKDGTNSLFFETGMSTDIDDDTTAISTLQNTLDTSIGLVGDTNSYTDVDDGTNKDTVYAYYNYFNGVPAGNPPASNYTQSVFNTYLQELETMVDSILSDLNTRYNSIEGIVGGTYSSDPADFTKLRKWRYFWINQKIGKPTGSRVAYLGMGTALTSANKSLADANSALSALAGTSYDEYIPTPAIIAAYYNPLINKTTGAEVTKRNGMVISGQNHATAYYIYRNVLSNNYNSNTEWNQTPYLTWTTVDDETGNISLIIDDENVSANTAYIYRVVVVDDTNDTFSSESLESNIFDETLAITFNNISNNKITFAEAHGLTKRQYVYIKTDTGNTTIDGYYRIALADETSITFADTLDTTDGGKVYPISCVATTEPAPTIVPAAGTTAAEVQQTSSEIYVKYEWDGTSLRLFDLEGTPGPFVDLKGPAGTGIELSWNSQKSYSVYEIVAYQNELYAAIAPSLGDIPDVSPSKWLLVGSATRLNYLRTDSSTSQSVVSKVTVKDLEVQEHIKIEPLIKTSNYTIQTTDPGYIIGNSIDNAVEFTLPSPSSVIDLPIKVENRHYGYGLMQNGDCESTTNPTYDGTSEIGTGATWARSSEQAFVGTYSYKLTKTGATDTYALFVDNNDTNDLHGLVLGQTYTLAGRMKVPSSGGPSSLSEADVLFSYHDGVDWNHQVHNNTEYDEWQGFNITRTIPTYATATYAFVQMNGSATIGEFFYIDELQLYRHNQPDLSTNFVTNGDCESTTAPSIDTGIVLSNGTFVRSGDDAHSGSYSYKFSVTTGGTIARVDVQDSLDTADMHGLTANKTYTFVVWMKVPSSGGPSSLSEVEAILQYYNGSTWVSVSSSPTQYDTWEKIVLTSTFTNATGVSFRPFQFDSTVSSGEYAYVDDIQVYEDAVAPLIVKGPIENRSSAALSEEGQSLKIISDGSMFKVDRGFRLGEANIIYNSEDQSIDFVFS